MEINDRHVEWAVVNRLKAMLEVPSNTEFEVTQSFALFTTILLWTKQRLWIGGNAAVLPTSFTQQDRDARGLRNKLGNTNIFDAPWSLSKGRPPLPGTTTRSLAPERINLDFEGMMAEGFVTWLRNAVAHSDGRGRGDSRENGGGGKISPINRKPTRTSSTTYLEGFEISFAAKQGSVKMLTLSLYRHDMVRIGSILADEFCKALSEDDKYFERDAATASTRITEAA